MNLLRRIAAVFRSSSLDREIADELQAHVAMRTEDNIAAGMSPATAARDARLRFGNITSTREQVKHIDAALTLENIWRDLRYALRQFWRNPGFSFTVVLVLTLGIAASVAIFAFVDAVLIKPLPYQNPNQLVSLFESTPLGTRYHLSYLDYLDWKRQNGVFRSMDAFHGNSVSLRTAEGIQLAHSAAITAGFFRTLGVIPMLGRDFREGEDVANGPHIVMLSYETWQKRYGAQPDVLSKTVDLSEVPHEIVGVLPKNFNFAPAGTVEFWTPVQSSLNPNDRGEHGLSAIARLADGVTLQRASADVNAIAAQLAKQYPDSDGGRGATVVPLTEVVVGNLRPILLLLFSGSLLLLLIACVNVSGLLLVRSESRKHEMAIRGALGASRMRLIQQLAIEGLTLFAVAGVLGVFFASGAIHLLRLLIPSNMLAGMPYFNDLGLNSHVLIFTAAVVVTVGVLSTCMPLLRLSLIDLREGLVESGRSTANTIWRHLGANLVVVELCIAMMLLVGAGLLGKSFYKLLKVDIGMQPANLATLQVGAPQPSYGKTEQQVALSRQVIDEVSHLPGVESVAIAHQIPVSNASGGNTGFQIVGKPAQSNSGYETNSRQVSANYFKTIQARLLHGRYFTEQDDLTKPRVAIVNEEFAQRFFPGEEILGKQIRYDDSSPVIEIVGIVANLKEGPLDETVSPALYTPFNQEPDPLFFIIARTSQAPQTLLHPIANLVTAINPDIMRYSSETMEDRIRNTQTSYLHQTSAWLVGGFAFTALLLGMVGLYGVIAYSVSQRTREIGVRMALGAQRGSLYRMILREAGRLMLAGLILGSICSVAGANLIRKLLFGTQPWDVPTLFTVSAALALATMLASFLPARRAASIDPVEALRAE